MCHDLIRSFLPLLPCSTFTRITTSSLFSPGYSEIIYQQVISTIDRLLLHYWLHTLTAVPMGRLGPLPFVDFFVVTFGCSTLSIALKQKKLFFSPSAFKYFFITVKSVKRRQYGFQLRFFFSVTTVTHKSLHLA